MPQLGNWDPSNAVCARIALGGRWICRQLNLMQIPFDSTNYPTWRATVYLPPSTTFEYKSLRKEPNGTVRPFLGSACAKLTFTDILDGCAWVDHVGNGSDQRGYNSGVRTTVDCDKLELSDDGDVPDWSRILPVLFDLLGWICIRPGAVIGMGGKRWKSAHAVILIPICYECVNVLILVETSEDLMCPLYQHNR